MTAAFTSFGTHLVQFQKFEPRFGGPDELPEEQRNRRDLTIEDAQALKRLSKLVAAVSHGALPVRRRRRCARARRRPTARWSLGTNPDYSEANTHFVQDGRFLTDADLSHAAPCA